MVPMAELHCHIEGAAAPELVLVQARRYGVDVSAFIRDGIYVWHDFTSFLAAYDTAASLFRSEEDYAALSERHLSALARDGAIYAELFVSPDHARRAGTTLDAYVDGIAEGMERCRLATGLDSRMIVTAIRHFGVEAVEQAARWAAGLRHPLVTGFGMAGEERCGDARDFARAFEIARDGGLGLTVHAGELAGWESVQSAMDHLRPARIGHGVRAAEHAGLVQRIADAGVVLECCPLSNIALKIFASLEEHPFDLLRQAGCKVTLNSDDPPHFHTSLRREYETARDSFGLDDMALAHVTRTAIEAAFVDEQTRSRLLARLDAATRPEAGQCPDR